MASLEMTITLTYIVLFVSMMDDLFTRKVHNIWLIAAGAFLIPLVLLYSGLWGVVGGLGSATVLFIVVFPLTLFQIVGPGDGKLLMLVAFLVGWSTTLVLLGFALFWGALFGLIRSLLSFEFKTLVARTSFVAFERAPLNDPERHVVPFTVALFLGWLTVSEGTAQLLGFL